jgi:hypothetical protein
MLVINNLAKGHKPKDKEPSKVSNTTFVFHLISSIPIRLAKVVFIMNELVRNLPLCIFGIRVRNLLDSLSFNSSVFFSTSKYAQKY